MALELTMTLILSRYLQHSKEYKKALEINENSKILFFGTEGDTDATIYEKMVGKSSDEILGNI